MKAMLFTQYGPPEVLHLQEVDRPIPKDGEVLVRVHAASLVWADMAFVRGSPFVSRLSTGLLKPRYQIPGMDMAGRVEAVGPNAKSFRPGDEVFGDVSSASYGAFAEYVCARQDAIAHKPANTSFAQAAAVPQAALVALQALRDNGQIQPGHRVLVNGASGGNGTFAVQLAKSFGAEVTAVCSSPNLDLVSSLGADHAIDYTREDFTEGGPRYDLVLDIVGNQPVARCLRALAPGGVYVAVPFSAGAMLLGPVIAMLGGKKLSQFMQKPRAKDLVVMKELIEAGGVTPVVDRRFPLDELPRALRYAGEGHPRGKIVIAVVGDG